MEQMIPPFETFYEAHRDEVFRFLGAAARPRAGRGRLPGDVPPRAASLSATRARRPPARLGLHDREPDRRRRRPPATARRASCRSSRPRTACPAFEDLAPLTGRPAAEGARGRRAALRLRPGLRRDRRRARLDRGGGPPGGLRRRPPAAKGATSDDLPRPRRALPRGRGRGRAARRRLRRRATTRRSGRCSSASPTAASAGSASTPSRSITSRCSRASSARACCARRSRSSACAASSTSTSPAGASDFDLEPDVRFLPGVQPAGARRARARRVRARRRRTARSPRSTGNPRAARAVGTVMNRNPIPIVLPCHRVIGASGSLTGYAAGSTARSCCSGSRARSSRADAVATASTSSTPAARARRRGAGRSAARTAIAPTKRAAPAIAASAPAISSTRSVSCALKWMRGGACPISAAGGRRARIEVALPASAAPSGRRRGG